MFNFSIVKGQCRFTGTYIEYGCKREESILFFVSLSNTGYTLFSPGLLFVQEIDEHLGLHQ